MTKKTTPNEPTELTGLELPQINIWRTRALYMRVYAAAMAWNESVLDEQTLGDFIDALHEALPKADKSALSLSCAYLSGMKLSRKLLGPLCWRLAANHRVLARGEPVYPWLGQALDQYVTVQIIGVTPPATLRLRVLSGRAAGSAVTVRVYLPTARRLFKALGFSKVGRGLHFTMSRPYDLLRLLFVCRLIPAAGENNVAIWHKSYRSTQSMLWYNKHTIKARRTLARNCKVCAEAKCYTCNVHSCPAFGYSFVDD